jgi:hypothetical protein
MKALSLQQPYADLIVERAYENDPHKVLKDVENRKRPLPATLILPARIYVHASLGFYPVKLSEIREMMTVSQWLRIRDRLHSIYRAWEGYKNDPQFRQRLGYFGCIIGEVTVTGQMRKTTERIPGHDYSMGDKQRELELLRKSRPGYFSTWYFGPFGYTLTDPVRYDKGIPYKGSLGFFEVEDKYIDENSR